MNLLRRTVLRCLPRGVKDSMRSAVDRRTLVSNTRYDFHRFWRWSSLGKNDLSQDQLLAHIMMDSHRVEKGLSLSAPRPGFGQDCVRRLIDNLDKFTQTFGESSCLSIAINALVLYQAFNREQQVDLGDLRVDISRLREQDKNLQQDSCRGGTTPLTREAIWKQSKLDLENFFSSRHSVRQFIFQRVESSDIRKAVEMAKYSPSVCNRQSWKAYAFYGAEAKAKVLSFQNGNRGFGDQAGCVLVVTSDLRYFVSAGERNQAWIDGGMFSMSLILALHSLGLGTCCLNWSVLKETDQGLREAAGIPDSEVVIMQIAVGHLPEKLAVATSTRKAMSLILVEPK